MTRGRKPIPAALDKLRGQPGKRRAKPEPVGGALSEGKIPFVLRGNAEAVRAWRRFAPLLIGMGVLRQSDETALALLCLAWSDYRKAQGKIATTSEVLAVYATDAAGKSAAVEGEFQVNPWVRLRDKAWERLVRLLPEFGLTPSARARLPQGAPEAADPFEALLAGRGTEN